MPKIEVPYSVASDGEPVHIFLVHGAWHRPECWDKVRLHLESRGFATEAPDLPSEDPDKTFDDDADVVVAAVEDSGAEDVVIAGHSRAGNVIIRAANELERKRKLGETALKRLKIIHISTSVHLDTLSPRLRGQAAGTGVSGIGLTRLLGERTVGRVSELDKEFARLGFYHDSRRRVARAALQQLRPQRIVDPQRESRIEFLPESPSEYIHLARDTVVPPIKQNFIASEIYGLKIPPGPSQPASQLSDAYKARWTLGSDHGVMFSHPLRLADVLAWRAKLIEWPLQSGIIIPDETS